MNIFGKFNSDEIEIHAHPIALNNIKKNVTIKFIDVPFTAIIVLLKDPHNIVRGLFSFESFTKTYVIAETCNESTNCVLSGRLPSGDWTLYVIRTSHIEPPYNNQYIIDIAIDTNSTIPSVDIPTKNMTGEKWYSGELHSHSVFSDSEITLTEIVDCINTQNIDYFFISEHNIVWNKKYLSGCVYSSSELSIGNDSHINLKGLDEMIDYSKIITPKDSKLEILEKIIDYIKIQNNVNRKNVLISLNHPFHMIPFIENISLENIDLIEIINAPYNPAKNKDRLYAMIALDFLWKRGYRIYGVGGSDAHNKIFNGCITLGCPRNYTYSKSNSRDDIISSLKLGHNIISTVGAISIKIKGESGKEYLPGDMVSETFTYDVESKKSITWCIIKNGKCIRKEVGNKICVTEQLSKNEFFRIHAINEKNEPIIFINPIYNEIIKKQATRWGDVLNNFLTNNT